MNTQCYTQRWQKAKIFITECKAQAANCASIVYSYKNNGTVLKVRIRHCEGDSPKQSRSDWYLLDCFAKARNDDKMRISGQPLSGKTLSIHKI
jgi:hypothetical protein